jgi:hypothetical protein
MNGNFKKIFLMPGLLLAFLATPAAGAELDVSVTNMTSGIYFTPLLVGAHTEQDHLFTAGEAASSSLEIMAECGDISELVADLSAVGADTLVNPAEGLLAPGATATGKLMTSRHNRYLSLVAMLLPTNDGFVGLDSLPIPRASGTYIYDLYGFDAGTEINDEILFTESCDASTPGIPGDPPELGGQNGTGVAAFETNLTVHIHPGNVGDLDDAGGPSDLSSAYHQWHNPVARLVITVHERSHKNKWGN